MRHLIARASVTLLLFVSVLSPFTTAFPASAAAVITDSSIVRSIVYRDLMPPNGPELIENFASGTAPILSGDGATAVYSITRADGPADAPVGHVYRFDIASQTATEIDQTTYAPMLDISDDGATILTMHQAEAGGPRLIRIANASGARTVVEEEGVELIEAVLSGDGKTVIFVLARDGVIAGIDGVAHAGIWAINADGSDLRQLASAEDVRPLMNAQADDIIFFGNYPMQVDVAESGDQAVFTTINYRTGEYFAFSLGRGGVRFLGGPYGILTRLAISGDGSTVLSLTAPFPYYSAPSEYAVSKIDGSNRRVLAAGAQFSDAYEKGTQLSQDGSLALLGSTGILFDTATGDAISLAAGCGSLSGSVLPNLTMDGAGRRFLYISFDDQGFGPLTLLELNPADVAPGVPVISDAVIDPAVITAGDGITATVSARIEADGPAANCVLALNGIVNEAALGLGVANSPMVDDGTLGDEIAGDGIYTVNTMQAAATIVSGPRTVRIKVEVPNAAGYRSAVAVDVEPFAVEGVGPISETPVDVATAPVVETTPTAAQVTTATAEATAAEDDNSGGALDTDDDGATADWSEWEGEPPAAECSAPPLDGDVFVETFVTAASAPPDDSLVPLQVDTEAEVPAGDPVDAETTAAVLDTVRQLAACMNAGDTGFFGLFTASGLATLFVYIGLPLQPLDDQAIQDLHENVGAVIEASPEAVAEGERSSVKEIRDVRLLPDGRVLVISVGVSPNGEQLGYLVLKEVDGRWLIDYIGVIGDPIEINPDF